MLQGAVRRQERFLGCVARQMRVTQDVGGVAVSGILETFHEAGECPLTNAHWCVWRPCAVDQLSERLRYALFLKPHGPLFKSE